MKGKTRKRKYRVPVYVTMTKTFEVKAENPDIAEDLVNCQLCEGGVLTPENCMEWNEVTEEREIAEAIPASRCVRK